MSNIYIQEPPTNGKVGYYHTLTGEKSKKTVSFTSLCILYRSMHGMGLKNRDYEGINIQFCVTEVTPYDQLT